jgi:peptide/nickel transport system substrate-binding protein
MARWLASTLLLCCALGAAGCLPSAPTGGRSETAPGTPPAAARPVPLVRLAWADVGFPTPFRISTAGPGGAVLLTLLYDTLTWKDERGMIPWLATRWEVSADGRAYTFTLAPNVRWHDGQPLGAEDVAFSFDYYARFPYRWMSTAVVERASVVAADQVRVRLRQPYAPFLEEIAGVVPIVPKHVWSKVSDPLRYDGPDATVGSARSSWPSTARPRAPTASSPTRTTSAARSSSRRSSSSTCRPRPVSRRSSRGSSSWRSAPTPRSPSCSATTPA